MTKEKESYRPKDYCPNCWGHFDYDDKIRVKLKDRAIDVNNHKKVRGFIEDFAKKHVDGIRLKAEKDSYHCPKCETNYRQKDGTEE